MIQAVRIEGVVLVQDLLDLVFQPVSVQVGPDLLLIMDMLRVGLGQIQIMIGFIIAVIIGMKYIIYPIIILYIIYE